MRATLAAAAVTKASAAAKAAKAEAEAAAVRAARMSYEAEAEVEAKAQEKFSAEYSKLRASAMLEEAQWRSLFGLRSDFKVGL